jgi:putative peptidoglycan lipid II flippase
LPVPTLSTIKITPKIKSFFKKLLPVIAGAGIAQVNIFIGSLFGSFLPDGSLSHIYFADRFIQMPLALFGISMGLILLPEIARRVAKGEIEAAEQVQNKALAFTLRLTLPSVAVLISLSHSFVSIFYGHGKFSEISVQKTAQVLQVFALGLPAYVLAKVISSIVFAQKNSRTPVVAAIISILTNLLLNLVLIFRFQEIGIAIATTISGYVNVYVLCKKVTSRSFINKSLISAGFRMLLATVLMYLIIHYFKTILTRDHVSFINEIGHLATISVIGIVVYTGLLLSLKDTATVHAFMTMTRKIWGTLTRS